MPKSNIEFNHITIYVKNVEKSLHFYQKLLQFRLIKKYAKDYARLQSPKGKTTIALHKVRSSNKKNKTKDIVLYFETKNLESLCQKLARKGVRFSQMPKLMPWGWKHAYLKDPDGHELSLYWAGSKRFEKDKTLIN
jgi:catechol 2,3-dioxygenase-like lactoylglutathione lyase family enzyme